jgi:ubiquitin
VFGIRKSEAEKLSPEELEKSLETKLGYLKKIYAEDDEILFKMRLRPRGESKLIAPDVHLAKFFDYLAAYPKRKPLD